MLPAPSSPPGKISQKCAVPNCPTRYYNPLKREYRNKILFRVPQDPERRSKWLEILKMPPITREIRICEDHFGPNAFTNSMENRLFKFAVPIPHAVPAPEVAENVDVYNYESILHSLLTKQPDNEIVCPTVNANDSNAETSLNNKTNITNKVKKKKMVYRLPSGRKIIILTSLDS